MLIGCAVHEARRDNHGTIVADADGPLSYGRSYQLVQSLIEQTNYPPLAYMATEISALSDLPLYTDNRVELLIDGPVTYRNMKRAIKAAQHYVLLETFIFADDEEGREFADLLTEVSASGVVVRVIYDSIGSLDSEKEFFERMEAGGIELIAFNKINPLEGGNPLTFNRRNHRKLLVVDGQVAFTGGVNLSDEYAKSSSQQKKNARKEGWRDTHIEIRGPAVSGFEDKFMDSWEALTEHRPLPRTGKKPAEYPGRDIVAILAATGGDSRESPIFAAYHDAISVARKRVWITHAYFAPHDEFMERIIAAAQRGVDVRILVPGFSDSRLVLNASRSRYTRLLKSGIRIWEAQDALLHAKTAVVDSVWSTVGSSNLDYRSFLHNDELNAFILGQDFATLMEAQFAKDLEKAREVTLAKWKDRPLHEKIKQSFSWLVEYWL